MRTVHNDEAAEAAEFAVKAHVLRSDRHVLANCENGSVVLGQVKAAVDLTEAPEDAICSLVIDLLHYCQREKIDWQRDVMARATKRVKKADMSTDDPGYLR